MIMRELTKTEMEALEWLKYNGGSVLTSRVPDKNERDPVFRTLVPGLSMFEKLEKLDLVVITEEEPMEDDFCFTPSIEFTEMGRDLLQSMGA